MRWFLVRCDRGMLLVKPLAVDGATVQHAEE
jgi:hypothetical protein